MSKWIPIRESLPGRSDINPYHSRTVLTCIYLKPNDTPENIMQAKGVYEQWMREAYYNFVTAKWSNDFLAQFGDVILATHWMELPDDNDPAWTPPPAEANMSKLVVAISGNERIPITSASYDSISGQWLFMMDIKERGGLIQADRAVTSWMPLPPPPDQY